IKTEIREALAVNAIPAIINPKFESVKATAYSQDELVFFIKIGDQIKGYPSSILNWHEIVNDEIGGIKIIVTFDPISYTAAAYERNNSIFGVSGKLYKNNLVMYSNETDTLWSQLTGIQLQEIKSGETQDSANVISLKQIPILRITFKEFNKQFPNGLILSHDQGFNRDYNENPYDDYLKSDDIGIFGDTASDERLEQKKIIYGIHIGSHFRAYSQDILDDGITNDFISDIPILIFNDNKTQLFSSFYREFNGDTLTFKKGITSFTAIDDRTQTTWSLIDGMALEGQLKGSKLEQIPGIISFWFAWSDFYPNTEIYRD
ncbi:MAG TPA: DUF3179 domain-containing protein, partial [Candidatus Babeliales bacterium]|nr:DUF3179 domain-containing protein [Candidatus Babeliales bacterium]